MGKINVVSGVWAFLLRKKIFGGRLAIAWQISKEEGSTLELNAYEDEWRLSVWVHIFKKRIGELCGNLNIRSQSIEIIY